LRISGLRVDSVAKALPVVLSGRGNSVSIVAVPNLVSGFELPQSLFHGGELGVSSDTGMEPCRDVLRGSVHALHVLEEADDLRHRLRKGMIDLLGNRRDLRAH